MANPPVTLKRCLICGLQKPLAEFAAGALNLSALSQVRKYSDICNLCQKKTKNRFNMSHFKNQFFVKEGDDDDSGSRGKGSRLIIDVHSRIFASLKQIKAEAQRTAMKKVERATTAARNAPSSKK